MCKEIGVSGEEESKTKRMTELAKRSLLCQHRLENTRKRVAARMAKCTITLEDLQLKPLTDAEIKYKVELQPLGKITNESLLNV